MLSQVFLYSPVLYPKPIDRNHLINDRNDRVEGVSPWTFNWGWRSKTEKSGMFRRIE